MALADWLLTPLGRGNWATRLENRHLGEEIVAAGGQGMLDMRVRLGGSHHQKFFGLERLADVVSREDAAGHPAPETMRRLMHAILAHQAGDLRDDATAMLLEWRGGGAQRITP